MRSNDETMIMHYLGGLEQAIPYFAVTPENPGPMVGLMPHLAHLVGKDFFEDEAKDRWATLLASDCRTAREMCYAFNQFTFRVEQERVGVSELHQALFEGLAAGTEDPSQADLKDFAGECEGKVQLKMMQELERVREARLHWEVERVRSYHTDREAKAFLHCDPLSSTQWVRALPTAREYLSNGQLTEIAAKFMGLKSPACAPFVGQGLCGQRVG